MKLLALTLLAAAAAFGQTSATITVTADGTQPFTYSWKKDGATIAGATSKDLVLSPLASTQTGAYSATVLNAAGSATTAPTNLVVLTSSTAAVDLSKQYLEASLSGPWDPPVAQFPQFVITPLKKVSDPGNHFNDATGIYTVGAGEAGTYETTITLRVQDQPPPNVSIGLTSGTANLDDGTLWVITPPAAPDDYVRFGAIHVLTRTLPAGAQIRWNLFIQKPIQIIGYRVTLRRLP